MAVLKSFELDGNKLSFANWISNLSPKTTPFTSMIGKEKLDAASYMWQTDTLDRASSTLYQEGSEAYAAPRVVTNTHINFTSIARKAVKISDTEKATANSYGRKAEMIYQMGKAGTELIRDIEFMNLSTREAKKGADGIASQHAGFKELCAPMFVPDVDTGAVTHQGIPFQDPKKPWFTLKDIFNVTTNLFQAGSKADKIMFHPRHISIFSDLLGFNEEEPLVYRMFDNLDEKFNASVTKIKDPVGRLYTLIPNRLMPEEAVYFFHEDNWTQKVLRAPKITDLGKTGSTAKKMIEAEIGLVHKNPYASGVLHMVESKLFAELKADETRVVSSLDDLMNFELVIRDLNGDQVVGATFKVLCSDESILELKDVTGTTVAGGLGVWQGIGKKPGRVTVYAYQVTGAGAFISNSITIDVVPVDITTTLGLPKAGVAQRFNAVAHATRFDKVQVKDGVGITWHTDSPNVKFYDRTTGADLGREPTVLTDSGDGKCTVKIQCDVRGTYHVWNSINGVMSSRVTLVVGAAELDFTWDTGTNKNEYTVDLDGETVISVTVVDKSGADVPDDIVIAWRTTNPLVATLELETSVTKDGEASNKFTPVGSGSVGIEVTCFGANNTYPIESRFLQVDTVINPSNTIAIGGVSALQSFVTDGYGRPVANRMVNWTASTSNVELGSIQKETDASGEAQVSITGKSMGEGNIETKMFNKTQTATDYFVGKGASISLDVSPTPAMAGQEVTLSGSLLGQDGVGIENVDITFITVPAQTAPVGPFKTLADGSYEVRFTPLLNDDIQVTAQAVAFNIQESATIEFVSAEYSYRVSEVANRLTMGVGSKPAARITVLNPDGTPADGVEVECAPDAASDAVVTFPSGNRTATDGGVNISVEPKILDDISFKTKVKGKSVEKSFDLIAENPTITFSLTEDEITLGQQVGLKGKLFDANGIPVKGVVISFSADVAMTPTPVNPTTDDSGNYHANWTPDANSDFEIRAHIAAYPAATSNMAKLTVI